MWYYGLVVVKEVVLGYTRFYFRMFKLVRIIWINNLLSAEENKITTFTFVECANTSGNFIS